VPSPSPKWVFRRLLDHYGQQRWWPADTRFEMMVGAVLTQNTSWTNVEKAIKNLKQEGGLEWREMHAVSAVELAELIRPSGYFNVKSRRLKNLCAFLHKHGGAQALAQLPTESLRQGFLSINGVGPETADAILLYGFKRPVFVIDAYTRRIFSRLGVIDGHEPYEVLRIHFQESLGLDQDLFNEYHALIVRHAKVGCKKAPNCKRCILASECQRCLQ